MQEIDTQELQLKEKKAAHKIQIKIAAAEAEQKVYKEDASSCGKSNLIHLDKAIHTQSTKDNPTIVKAPKANLSEDGKVHFPADPFKDKALSPEPVNKAKGSKPSVPKHCVPEFLPTDQSTPQSAVVMNEPQFRSPKSANDMTNRSFMVVGIYKN